MAVDKIDVVNDPRIQKVSANLNGRTYGYLLAQPKEYNATIFLIHGFPDISMGWRYQIPMLLDLGFRVVCPDSIGYGRTDAPPYKLADYSYKRAAHDIKELARQLGASRIVLGGHDWGGAIVYRVALWCPGLISHVFAVCTPYFAPNTDKFETLDQPVKKRYKSFKYQQHFASGDIEEAVQSRSEIRQFLNGAYGGRGPNREMGMRMDDRVYLEHLAKLAPTPLLTEKVGSVVAWAISSTHLNRGKLTCSDRNWTTTPTSSAGMVYMGH